MSKKVKPVKIVSEEGSRVVVERHFESVGLFPDEQEQRAWAFVQVKSSFIDKDIETVFLKAEKLLDWIAGKKETFPEELAITPIEETA